MGHTNIAAGSYCLECGADSPSIPQCLVTVFGADIGGICCEQSLDFLDEIPSVFAGESVEKLVKKELRFLVN
jgi:hypothetical protein